MRLRKLRNTSRKQRLVGVAVAVAAVAVGTFGAADLARADDVSVQGNAVLGVPGNPEPGYFGFTDNGDQFYVADILADGYGVKGYLLDADKNVLASSYNGKGAHGGLTEFGYDIKAGRTYYMKVCTVDGPNQVQIQCATRSITE